MFSMDGSKGGGGGPGGVPLGHHLACTFEEHGPRQLASDWHAGKFGHERAFFKPQFFSPKQQLPSAFDKMVITVPSAEWRRPSMPTAIIASEAILYTAQAPAAADTIATGRIFYLCR